MVIEADVQEGSTPLRDLFDQIASGQSKITFAQLKVCICSQSLAWCTCFCMICANDHHWRATFSLQSS